MKHKLLSSIVLLAALAAPTLSHAYDFSAVAPSGQTLYYNIVGGEAQVTYQYFSSSNYYNLTGSLTIPSSVTHAGTTYSVTSIGNQAFSYCSGLTLVTIPNSVTSIGYQAFWYCSGLTSMTIPNSVTSIVYGAFYGCSGLTLPVYNNTLYAYLPSSYSGSYVIPDGITTICDGAFYNCSGLTSVTIPNSVTSIGDYVFYGCSGLTSVTIPNSVTSFGASAFNDCINLSSIIVANGNSIYDSRNNCNAIIETATNTLIAGCKNTVIPNFVTSIRNDAFYGCSGLTSATIPNSVTSIGNGAFYGCSGLTSVTIPNSVTSIGDNAFCGCIGLTSVTIGNSVTSIGVNAFCGCIGLTSVTIPNSVTSIGNYAFCNCTGLDTVYLMPLVPPTLGSYVFSDNDYPYPIYNSTNEVFILSGCSYDAYYNVWVDYRSQLREPIINIDFHVTPVNTDRGSTSIIPLRGRDVRCDSSVVVSASPRYGYHFSHWSNGSTANPDTLYLTGDSAVTAYFAPNTYTVTARSGNDALGYASGSGEYLYRDTIELSATCTEPHYHFSHWNDGSTDNPRQYVVEGNSTLTAYFEIDVHTVRVTCDVARGTVSGSGVYTYGSACTVEAQEPYTGFVFHSWSNGVTANPYVFAVIGDIELSAIFVAEGEEVYTISVESVDPDMGYVSGGGQALAGGRITIRAQGYPGYRFLRWQDGNTDSVRTVTVTGNATYTAYFGETVRIDDVADGEEVRVWSYDGRIHVAGAEGKEVCVYDMLGRLVRRMQPLESGKLEVAVPAGVYLVRIGNLPARKVVVVK